MSYQKNYANNSLNIKGIHIYKEDVKSGNPYNSSAVIEVVSGSFSGISEFEFDIKQFDVFVDELKSMYNDLSGKATLKDISYGSYISFEMNKKGHLIVSGLLFDNHKEQSLTFLFETDQTILKDVIREISNLKES